MTNCFTLAAGSLCLLSSAVLAEVPPIERLAPENSIIIAGTSNTARAMANFKKTGLWSLWESDRMIAMRADAMKEMGEDLKEMMQDLGVDEDSLVCPPGAAGMALFTVPDPDLGTPTIAMLAYVDYGDDADKTEKLIRAALERGEKEGKLEFDEKDIAGRSGLVIDLSKMRDQDAGDDFGGAMFPLPLPSVDDIVGNLVKLHMVRDGNTLIVSSDMTALTDALDAIDGRGASRFAQRPDFQNTRDLIGGENDLYAVMLTRNSMDLLGEGGMMMAMMRPTLRALTGEVGGYAMGMRFDSGSAMVEQTVGVYMPRGKKGLTELMDKPSRRGDVPAFIGPDATSVTVVNFDFTGLMGVIKNVINSNPMLAGQAGQVMDQVEPMMTPIFNALGGKMVMGGSVMAMECKDPQGFENGFAGLAAQGGLESRDFLGHRIYTMKEGLDLGLPIGGAGIEESFSLGIGGGFVYMGSTPSVEQALRAAGNPDAATLGRSPEFQRAVAALGDEQVVAWGYSDLAATVESTIKQQAQSMKDTIEMIREFDPDMAAEMEKDAAGRQKMTEQIDAAFLRKYIGAAVWQVRSTDRGFVMNNYMLPASK